MSSLGPEYVFMDDNASCHRAVTVVQWMHAKKLKCMEVWPTQSPDLNPIEDVSDMLAKSVNEFRPKNVKELEEKLKEEWTHIPSMEVQKLINSMPCRISAVLAAKGGQTSY